MTTGERWGYAGTVVIVVAVLAAGSYGVWHAATHPAKKVYLGDRICERHRDGIHCWSAHQQDVWPPGAVRPTEVRPTP